MSNDMWIFTNLIDAPPPIIFGTVQTINNYVYIPWTYPSQINVGFMNIYLPSINTLSCIWSGNVNGTIMNNQPILRDEDGSNVIKYNNLIPNTTYITGIVLTNVNVNTGYQQLQFPQDVTGTLRNTYVYYSTHFSNLAKNAYENSFTAWYGNYSLNSHKSSVLFDGSMTPLLIIGPPSEPGIPDFSFLNNEIENNIRTPSVRMSWDIPRMIWTLSIEQQINIDTEPVIETYKYIYDTSGSTRRYGGPITDTSYNITTSNIVILTDLYPDCQYNFVVSAKNNVSELYGSFSQNSIFYMRYMNPISFGELSFTSPIGITTYSGKLVGNNNSGDLSGATVNNILFSLPPDNWISSPIISPIHSIENRGSSNNDLLRITGNIIRENVVLDSSEIFYNGFPATKPNNVIKSNFTITTDTPVDSYENNLPAYRGFYLQVNTFITLHNNLFSESNNKTIVSLEQYQDNENYKISNYSFYYEEMSNAPIINSFDISLNITNKCQISGIWVLYGNTMINATSVISNIGKSFYNNNQIMSYNSDNNNEFGRETDLRNVTQESRTDSQLNNQVTIINNGSPAIYYSNDVFSKQISIISTAYNALNLSYTSSPSSIMAIYDQPSYNLITNGTLYPTSVQIVGNATSSNLSDITGFRVCSDNTSGNIPINVTSLPSTKRYVDFSYNHAWDLTSQDNNGYDATQELQIFNGSYGSKGSEVNRKGYLNYTNYNISSSDKNTLDYSTITNSNYRFATFCWKCNENLRNYTKISFVMKGITQTIDTPNKKPTISGQPIYFYYRLEDNNNPTTFDNAHINTLWIDANSTTLYITTSNYCKLTLSGYISGTLLGGKNSDYKYMNRFIDDSLTINALIPSFSVSNTANIYIYLRVGLPMSVDINFTHITCSLI